MHYKTSTWPWRRIPAPALPCAGALALSPCPPQAMSSSTRSAVSSLHLGHSRRCCIHPLVPADAPPLKSFISTPVLRLVALPSQPLPSESGLRPPQYRIDVHIICVMIHTTVTVQSQVCTVESVFLYFACIHTLYILSCLPRFTCSRLST